MITASPSKSHTMRALFFAFMASGKSKIYHYLPSPDTSKMIDAMCAMGSILFLGGWLSPINIYPFTLIPSAILYFSFHVFFS